MTDQKTPTTQQTNKGGRPALPEHEDTPESKAFAYFTDSVNRADNYVSHHPNTSAATRGARCARAGIPEAQVMAGFDLLAQSVAEARQAVVDAYANPKKVAPKAAPRFG